MADQEVIQSDKQQHALSPGNDNNSCLNVQDMADLDDSSLPSLEKNQSFSESATSLEFSGDLDSDFPLRKPPPVPNTPSVPISRRMSPMMLKKQLPALALNPFQPPLSPPMKRNVKRRSSLGSMHNTSPGRRSPFRTVRRRGSFGQLIQAKARNQSRQTNVKPSSILRQGRFHPSYIKPESSVDATSPKGWRRRRRVTFYTDDASVATSCGTEESLMLDFGGDLDSSEHDYNDRSFRGHVPFLDSDCEDEEDFHESFIEYTYEAPLPAEDDDLDASFENGNSVEDELGVEGSFPLGERLDDFMNKEPAFSETLSSRRRSRNRTRGRRKKGGPMSFNEGGDASGWDLSGLSDALPLIPKGGKSNLDDSMSSDASSESPIAVHDFPQVEDHETLTKGHDIYLVRSIMPEELPACPV